MRFLAAILAATMLTACSFAFVSGPPDNHAQLSYFDCTSSRVAPVLDTVLTALMVANVLTLGIENDSDWAKSACPSDNPMCNPAISRHGAMILDGVIGAAGAAGMIYGWSKTSACRQAKREQAMRQVPQQPYMPGSWPPPAYGQPGAPYGQPGQPAPQAQPQPQPAPQAQPQPQPAPQAQPAPHSQPQPYPQAQPQPAPHAQPQPAPQAQPQPAPQAQPQP